MQVLSALGVTFAGVFGGAVHALTGADHLAALLPLCIGHGVSAWHVGMEWGLGHALGVFLFGTFVIGIKKWLLLSALEQWVEAAMGLSLFIMGVLGWIKLLQQGGLSRRRAKVKNEDVECAEENDAKESDRRNTRMNLIQKFFWMLKRDTDGSDAFEEGSAIVVFTGMIHGIISSGHSIGVLPAMALRSFLSAALYLAGLCIGTVVCMSLFTAFVGHASLYLGQRSRMQQFTRKLSAISSSFAIAFGLFVMLSTLYLNPLAEVH